MIFAVLRRSRDFRHLFAAELVMFGGDWFVMVPLLALLPKLTGSGLWGGLVLAADTGIQAVLLPFAGTVPDRLDRRRIMLATNAASMVAVLALLFVRAPGTAWIAPPADAGRLGTLAGPVGTGALFAARGLGAVIGPLLLRRVLAHRSWLLPGIAMSMATYGVAYLGVASAPWFWLVVLFVVLAHTGGAGTGGLLRWGHVRVRVR